MMRRAALVMAHPGHELRIHGWLEMQKPLVLILTDGSGGAATPRVEASHRLIERAGARVGPVSGACTDRELYASILRGDLGFFRALVERVTRSLAENEIDNVVGDAAEGYNPSHDLCRLILDVSVTALRRQARDVESYDYPVVGAPQRPGATPAMRVCLDDAALERKLSAARGYEGLEDEVTAAIDRHGAEAFRTECFYRAPVGALLPGADERPFYETYGEAQVAAGRYETVLRFADHILPLARALSHDC